MKQLVPNPTTPSDRTRIHTKVVNFRVLLPLDYFGKNNEVEMESDHCVVKQDQGKMLPSLATNRTKSPKKSLKKN